MRYIGNKVPFWGANHSLSLVDISACYLGDRLYYKMQMCVGKLSIFGMVVKISTVWKSVLLFIAVGGPLDCSLTYRIDEVF